MAMRTGDVNAIEDHFYWADASFFDAVPLPVLAGDPKATLARPDGLVLTRTAARRYFGRDLPVGETLLVNGGTPMVVGAVIADIPTNSQLALGVLASSKSPISELAQFDADPRPRFGDAYTYVRLNEGASPAQFRELLAGVVDRHMPPMNNGKPVSTEYQLDAIPIMDVHLSPEAMSEMKPRGDRVVLVAIGLVGLLIVIIAAMNFVGQATARAATRAVEVGVRKTCGAFRRNLIEQFLGETFILMLCSSVLALAIGEAVTTPLGASFGQPLSGHWTLAAAAIFAAAAALIAILAGSYPAFVLSAFHPSVTLRSGATRGGGSGLRQVFVAVQFACLIGLGIATVVMHAQIRFGMDRTLTTASDEMLIVDTACTGSFPQEIRRLPGVMDARCSGSMLAGQDIAFAKWQPNGSSLVFAVMNAAPGLLELYGAKPVAGRLLLDTDKDAIVLNEAAVRALGYVTNEAVLGTHPFPALKTGEVVGVVPDFSLRSVREIIRPTIYSLGNAQRSPFTTLNVKLAAGSLPQTLGAIDALWRDIGDRPGPIVRRFFDQYVQALYDDTMRQEKLFSVLSAVALFLACLGLFGLASQRAIQRTREIGVRKALGAARAEILRLVLWEFTRPVLWASAVAWPIVYVVMRRWLEGFAYHVDLAPWMFALASMAALAIAIVTVSGHALLIARSQPVTALRYE
jgi:putative ABC transport system permease protein